MPSWEALMSGGLNFRPTRVWSVNPCTEVPVIYSKYLKSISNSVHNLYGNFSLNGIKLNKRRI